MPQAGAAVGEGDLSSAHQLLRERDAAQGVGIVIDGHFPGAAVIFGHRGHLAGRGHRFAVFRRGEHENVLLGSVDHGACAADLLRAQDGLLLPIRPDPDYQIVVGIAVHCRTGPPGRGGFGAVCQLIGGRFLFRLIDILVGICHFSDKLVNFVEGGEEDVFFGHNRLAIAGVGSGGYSTEFAAVVRVNAAHTLIKLGGLHNLRLFVLVECILIEGLAPLLDRADFPGITVIPGCARVGEGKRLLRRCAGTFCHFTRYHQMLRDEQHGISSAGAAEIIARAV